MARSERKACTDEVWRPGLAVQVDEPYDEAIKRISSLGFRAVELIAWTREVLDAYYTPATIRELRAIIDGFFLATLWPAR
jgi:hypothetical protein